jgi:hypothetical protein
MWLNKWAYPSANRSSRRACEELSHLLTNKPYALSEAYNQSLLNADRLRLALDERARRPDIWISSTLVERVLQEILAE